MVKTRVNKFEVSTAGEYSKVFIFSFYEKKFAADLLASHNFSNDIFSKKLQRLFFLAA